MMKYVISNMLRVSLLIVIVWMGLLLPAASAEEIVNTDENPQHVQFHDLSGDIGVIRGTINWFKAADETNIESYSVYFTDGIGAIIGDLATIPKDTSGDGNYSTPEITIDTPINATRIGVRANIVDLDLDLDLVSVSVSSMITVPIWDFPTYLPQELKFTDNNPISGSFNGVLRWSKPDNLSNIDSYRIFYFSGFETIIVEEVLADVNATEYSLTIPDGIIALNKVFYIAPLTASGEVAPSSIFHVSDNIFESEDDYMTSIAVLPLPGSLYYNDQDLTPGVQSGHIHWNDYELDSTASGYTLFYVLSNGQKRAFAEVAKTTYGSYQVFMSSTVNFSENAQSIELYARDNLGQLSGKSISVEMKDRGVGSYYATHLNFFDMDVSEGELAGKMTWSAPEMATGIQEYELHYVNSAYQRIGKIGAVAVGTHEFMISANTIIPEGAISIGLFSKSNLIMDSFSSINIEDTTSNDNSYYQYHLSSIIDQQNNGITIDDIVRFMSTSYDMNSDNTFDAVDVRLLLSLIQPIHPVIILE